ncbi:S41 family peptidase [Bombella apis]|uniref:Tail specific protease domain-containing protein n=1 Tax=Bombella apis TaxID=1785988 RepID=A0ABR9MQR1_9PROT|nr:S41 family peptidase [Bombella apis]MBE1724212.1 hypothetical protein [Bombella apis]MBR9730552.1 hypothetical protein [Bombella apis]
MMPVRLLRPVCTAFTGVALSGVLTVGSAIAQPVQAHPFWNRLLHHFAGRPGAPSSTPVGSIATTTSQPAGTGSSSRSTPVPTAPALPEFTDEDRLAELTLSTALTFMLPRMLTAHTPQELCLWGMQALLEVPQPLQQPDHGQAPSSSFTLAVQPGTMFSPAHMSLLHDRHPLLSVRTPGKDDVTGWSHLSLQLITLLRRDVPSYQLMNDETLLSRFLNGLLARLDPYSRYQSPPPPPSQSDAVTPAQPPPEPAASVGLTLRRTRAHFPVVAALNLDSPLWDAGIIPGDSLTSLDHQSTRQMALPALQAMLTGPAGSTVELEFRTQDGHHLIRNFTRGRMAEESVFPEQAGRFPVLRVTHFSSRTAEEVSQYLSTLLPETPPNSSLPHPPDGRTPPAPTLPGLVLDLRGNHGGILQQAVMTAALFLDHGVIATTEGRAAEANHVWSIQGGDLTNNTPLALLVDQDTGSAAEVLAAALADQQRAVVTGSSTFGKGMVQISSTLPNGGHLSLTWAHITAPQGWALQDLGVLPQLCTSPQGQFSLRDQLAALRADQSLMTDALRQSRLISTDSPEAARRALRQVCPPAAASPTDISAALALFIIPHTYRAALLHLPDNTAIHPAANTTP